MAKKKRVAKKASKTPRWVAVSGGFDPLHIGHVRMFKKARKFGDKLVVILNNDNWLRDKKGFAFMSERERKEIIESFPSVDRVVLTDHKPGDTDRSVVRTLRKLKPAVFANGGDRKPDGDPVPEVELCKELGIKIVYNVGHGGKVQSSSWMVKDAVKGIARSVRPWGEFYGWDSGDSWYVKTLVVHPGKRLSLQYHHKRSEHWVLVEGEATAITKLGDKLVETPLVVGEAFIVRQGTPHRLMSQKGGRLVEIAIGSAFDEADIVRLDDDFGRSGEGGDK
jgi:cytidyltransferase-like protein